MRTFWLSALPQLRDCSVYRGEFKECKSIRGRFNQYFIYGESLDCSQWKEDFNNCQKWNWFSNKEAAASVIESELKRQAARLKPHYDNDIWTKREHPPEDWSKPLPAFMEERNKNTFLEIRNNELKKEEEEQLKLATSGGSTKPVQVEAKSNSFCTFM